MSVHPDTPATDREHDFPWGWFAAVSTLTSGAAFVLLFSKMGFLWEQTLLLGVVAGWLAAQLVTLRRRRQVRPRGRNAQDSGVSH
jgi:hypothetical protein